MAEYVPVFTPGKSRPRTASAKVTGGQLVEVSGNDTVAPAAADSTGVVGVAGFDAAANDRVTIYSGGVQRPTASGAVTAGDLVAAAADGKVATTTDAALAVGVAETDGADGATVEVLFNR